MKAATFILCVLVLSAHALLVLADCQIAGRRLQPGETYQPPGRCVLNTCGSNGITTSKTCPSLSSLQPCKIVEDASKPFPKCCPRFDCANQNLRL
ncbi:venom peptide HsVx1 [Drosophila grimshawi]|uniref:GH24575 n=1 Tax=Drosophila grimshawi TaxID=7222 RepID=B4JM45_DROGR|nr:venom peptide HsVx1 [Drosophila grimshawi]EDV91806.1 GH24575 [Drosophila grimshawi]